MLHTSLRQTGPAFAELHGPSPSARPHLLSVSQMPDWQTRMPTAPVQVPLSTPEGVVGPESAARWGSSAGDMPSATPSGARLVAPVAGHAVGVHLAAVLQAEAARRVSCRGCRCGPGSRRWSCTCRTGTIMLAGEEAEGLARGSRCKARWRSCRCRRCRARRSTSPCRRRAWRRCTARSWCTGRSCPCPCCTRASRPSSPSPWCSRRTPVGALVPDGAALLRAADGVAVARRAGAVAVGVAALVVLGVADPALAGERAGGDGAHAVEGRVQVRGRQVRRHDRPVGELWHAGAHGLVAPLRPWGSRRSTLRPPRKLRCLLELHIAGLAAGAGAADGVSAVAQARRGPSPLA